MKTQKQFSKRPKSGVPISVKTLKGGCRYFFVSEDDQGRLFLYSSGVVFGKPCKIGGWKIRFSLTDEHHVFHLNLNHFGILDPYDLTRMFRFSSKVWSFYKDLVERQDLEAYKEAIKATL